MEEKIPAPVTPEERWIVHNRVDSVRVEYRQTGTDTAETYVHLTAGDRTVCWRDTTFKKVARLELSWATLVEPVYGLREKVEARDKWEKANAKELAEYQRLKLKYGATTPDAGAQS